jgi:RNA polymerase sigma factor (sigma-70 family)
MQTTREYLTAEPLLSATEEVTLARQIEAGVLASEAYERGGTGVATQHELRLIGEQGELARQRFIRANLRLVAMVASQFAGKNELAYGDLFQEGCVGLIMAVERFDHQRGVKFATYALFWIRAFVGAASARSLGASNLPTSRAEQLRSVRGVEVQLSQSLGRPPSLGELAAALGRSHGWTQEIATYEPPRSIDELAADDLAQAGDDPVAAVLETDRPGRELLWHLGRLERRVLELRLGFADGSPHSLAQIARELGITVARTRRLELRALENLRAVCPQAAAVHL